MTSIVSVPLRSAALLAAAAVLATALPAAAEKAVTQTRETQAALTPADARALLVAGNERFASGKMLERDYAAQVKATAAGQFPFAVVLGCIDSRVAPEIVFDQGVGDIFAPRIAGNFVNTDILGSMEFATAVAGARLIVVLGHTSCGAVQGACDGAELGNLTQTLSNNSPAVYATETSGERSSKNQAFVEAVARKNVELTVQNILDRSAVLRELVDAGKLQVVGAMHDVATGKVEFL
jgi:carbonic anhydrase